jgi:coenzyme F420 hydrogenase subunit beta
VGLNPGLLRFRETSRGPLPELTRTVTAQDAGPLQLSWAVCPGRGIPFPELFRFLGRPWKDMLLGPHLAAYTGHATSLEVRRAAASGGILTRVLTHLLESGKIVGAVVVRQGIPDPESASCILAKTPEEIRAAAQSVYAVTPTLSLLPEISAANGNLAFVGLPEQIAALRMLQAAGHPGARKVLFTAGPYTGTNMYRGAIRAFLRGHGVPDRTPLQSVRWRAGEWPGHLEVTLRDGRVFRAEKFYYNYLIPFYISRYCCLTPDFTNELADLSVGDAWSPAFEREGGGHSVVLARSTFAVELLDELVSSGEVILDPVTRAQALAMHGHMLDFKKRGAFLRLEAQARRGLPVPEYGYRPEAIPPARRAVEGVIGAIFAVCGKPAVRRIVETVPVRVLGPLFNTLRKSWKAVSKPPKRKGLAELGFFIHPNESRWREIEGAIE